MKLVFWNVEGLRGTVKTVNELLITSKILACFCSETWCSLVDCHAFEHYTPMNQPHWECVNIRDPSKGLMILVQKGYEWMFKSLKHKNAIQKAGLKCAKWKLEISAFLL